CYCSHFFFFFNATPPTQIYTLSLHDALPISMRPVKLSGSVADSTSGCSSGSSAAERSRAIISGKAYCSPATPATKRPPRISPRRSEEHTSELQSRFDLVCRLLLEKKKK